MKEISKVKFTVNFILKTTDNGNILILFYLTFSSYYPSKKENLNQVSNKVWHNFPYAVLLFFINKYSSSEVGWSCSELTAEDLGMVARLTNS